MAGAGAARRIVKHALPGTSFSRAAVASLLLPLALAIVRVSWSSLPDWTAQVSLHWLLMAMPQIPFVLIGGSSRRLRPRMWVPLTALCVLLLAYHAWVRWCVPPDERHLAQLFYATLALPIALLIGVVQGAWLLLARTRRRR